MLVAERPKGYKKIIFKTLLVSHQIYGRHELQEKRETKTF